MTNRIRYVSPDLFLDEDFAALPPKAQLFLIGLPTHCDREGRVEDCPNRLRVQIFPYDQEIDIEAIMELLIRPRKAKAMPFIVRYEVEGERYLQMINWKDWQRPHPNERTSRIPAPPPDILEMYDKRHTHVQHETDKGRKCVDGDGDGDWNGDWNGEGDPRGNLRKAEENQIDPPAPIQGSGRDEPRSEASPRPCVQENSIPIEGEEKEKSDRVPGFPSQKDRVPGLTDEALTIIAGIVKKDGPAAALDFCRKAKCRVPGCLRLMMEENP